jgi:hypothetical protein
LQLAVSVIQIQLHVVRISGPSLTAFVTLRHTFDTRLADADVDVVKIKELMGHFDCDNHALHPRYRSRKTWGDHCLIRVSTAASSKRWSQVGHKQKTAGSSTCRKSLKNNGEPWRARTSDPLIKSAVKRSPVSYGSYDLLTFVTGFSRQQVHLLRPIRFSLPVTSLSQSPAKVHTCIYLLHVKIECGMIEGAMSGDVPTVVTITAQSARTSRIFAFNASTISSDPFLLYH